MLSQDMSAWVTVAGTSKTLSRVLPEVVIAKQGACGSAKQKKSKIQSMGNKCQSVAKYRGKRRKK